MNRLAICHARSLRTIRLAARITAACALCLTVTDHCAAESPSHEELRQQAKRCRDLLEKSVVDFYLPHCLDTAHGGYLENIDREGRFTPAGGKFLTLQSRQLWFFSTLAENGIRKTESLAAARHGYDFLQSRFYDRDQGGYYSRVTEAGQPQDRRKHVYLNSFALYGLVAYHRASQDREALAAAQRLFEVLDDHAYDQAHGGYQEFFYDDWKPVVDPSETGYVGAINTKTYNTHLHLLESFAELYRAWPDQTVSRRLAELIHINTCTVRHPDYPFNVDGWSVDWRMIDTPRNLRASYGHDVECAWLVLDAARTLGWSPDVLRQWAVSVCDYSLQRGYDEQHGGFFYTGPPGAPADDRRKEWWVQSEAIVSMLEMFRLTGDERYYRAFASTLDFIEKHQIASAGGWWATSREDGSPTRNSTRTSMWQGGYHNGRALLLCGELLGELARQSQ